MQQAIWRVGWWWVTFSNEFNYGEIFNSFENFTSVNSSCNVSCGHAVHQGRKHAALFYYQREYCSKALSRHSLPLSFYANWLKRTLLKSPLNGRVKWCNTNHSFIEKSISGYYLWDCHPLKLRMNYLFKLSVLNVNWHRINTSYVTPLIISNIRNRARHNDRALLTLLEAIYQL